VLATGETAMTDNNRFPLTAELARIMAHAIGYFSGKHRNYYAIYEDNPEFSQWTLLVDNGLADKFYSSVNDEMTFFRLTQAGKDAVSEYVESLMHHYQRQGMSRKDAKGEAERALS
jgi:hypothetical protein